MGVWTWKSKNKKTNKQKTLDEGLSEVSSIL